MLCKPWVLYRYIDRELLAYALVGCILESCISCRTTRYNSDRGKLYLLAVSCVGSACGAGGAASSRGSTSPPSPRRTPEPQLNQDPDLRVRAHSW